MNSFKVIKKLIVGCSLGLLFLSTQASAFFGDDCCCPPPPCCGPLSENAFGILVKGGVTPTHFTRRGRLLFTNPSVSPPVFVGSNRLKFDKLFDTPWQVGVELQWNPCCNVQFFAEYVYERFNGKRRKFEGVTFFDSKQRFRDIDSNAFYLGARYYFGNLFGGDGCCPSMFDNISPFFGFKGGIVWQNSDRGRLEIDGIDMGSFRFFKKQDAVSAGVQFGIDWAVTCNIGIVFTTEAVVTQGLRPARSRALNPLFTGGMTNFSFPNTGRLVSYPVTLGLRYTF